MAIFRTENSLVLWSPETTWGERANPTRRFGLHETVQAADPNVAWRPFFGVATPRSRGTILRGRWSLTGGVPDILCQQGGSLGELLGMAIGRLSGNTVSEGITDTDERVKSMTMQIAMRDTDGSYALIREYYGGKINRATLSASEGEQLRLSVDEILFKDIGHNLSGVRAAEAASLGSDPGPSQYGLFTFAGATLNFFGTPVCRIKRFSLSIDNMLTPMYYLCAAGSDPENLTQVPNDIVEGKRSYSLSVELDVADESTDLELFKFLLNQGGPNGGATVGGLVTAQFAVAPGEGGGLLTIEAGLSTSQIQPGPVVTGGSINIPAPPAGLFPSSWTMDVDRVRITVP